MLTVVNESHWDHGKKKSHWDQLWRRHRLSAMDTNHGEKTARAGALGKAMAVALGFHGLLVLDIFGIWITF
jgi:hypothetical protein